MIESVKIGAITYTVQLAKHPADDGLPHLPLVEDNKWLAGEISYTSNQIYVHAGMAEDAMRQTLLHEVTHGVLRHAGQHALNADEELVDAIAYGFMALVRDNPKLIAYLQEQST